MALLFAQSSVRVRGVDAPEIRRAECGEQPDRARRAYSASALGGRPKAAPLRGGAYESCFEAARRPTQVL